MKELIFEKQESNKLEIIKNKPSVEELHEDLNLLLEINPQFRKMWNSFQGANINTFDTRPHNFADIIFRQIIEHKILNLKIKDLEENVLEDCFKFMEEKFFNMKFVFHKKNENFLQLIKTQAKKLVSYAVEAVEQDKFPNEETIMEFCNNNIAKYLDEIFEFVVLIAHEVSYTSTSFMQNKECELVSELSDITQNNKLYKYLHDNHWFLCLKENDELFVV